MHKHVVAKQYAIKNQLLTEKIKGEIKKCLETNENESTTIQNLFNAESSSKTVYNNPILPQETRKISNKHPNIAPKTTRERRKSKT